MEVWRFTKKMDPSCSAMPSFVLHSLTFQHWKKLTVMIMTTMRVSTQHPQWGLHTMCATMNSCLKEEMHFQVFSTQSPSSCLACLCCSQLLSTSWCKIWEKIPLENLHLDSWWMFSYPISALESATVCSTLTQPEKHTYKPPCVYSLAMQSSTASLLCSSGPMPWP